MAAKLMKFAEGQKQMLNSLRQNFSQEAEGSFTNFETFLEGLATRDTDNKKLVLDQVRHSILPSLLSSTKYLGFPGVSHGTSTKPQARRRAGYWSLPGLFGELCHQGNHYL